MTINKQKTIQLLITLFLIVVLGMILSAYIYFGMMKAKNNEIVNDQPVLETPAVTTDTDKRQEIINALSNYQSQPGDEVRRNETLDALSNIPDTTAQDASKRQAIIEAISSKQ